MKANPESCFWTQRRTQRKSQITPSAGHKGSSYRQRKQLSLALMVRLEWSAPPQAAIFETTNPHAEFKCTINKSASCSPDVYLVRESLSLLLFPFDSLHITLCAEGFLQALRFPFTLHIHACSHLLGNMTHALQTFKNNFDNGEKLLHKAPGSFQGETSLLKLPTSSHSDMKEVFHACCQEANLPWHHEHWTTRKCVWISACVRVCVDGGSSF